jgi:predicted nucleic acid-binding protein
MDDLDEESVAMGGKRACFTGPLAKYRWRALLPLTVSGDQRVALFSEGVEAISNAKTGAHLPELFRDIFRNAFLKFRDGRILTLFLNEVNGFAYSHREELGNASGKKRFRLEAEETETILRAMLEYPVLPLTGELALAAFALQLRDQISYWAAAIIAAARALGCKILYTEDLNAGQDYGGVVARTPFANA